MTNYDYKSAIVIPCYNEATRINIEKYITDSEKMASFFILVDDGSPDETFKLLKQLEEQAPDRFEAIQMPKNSGKAEAVRFGMKHAVEKYKDINYVGFLDADLAVNFSEILIMLDCFKLNSDINTVIGVRSRLAGHKVDRSFLQYGMQRIIAKMGTFLFNPEVIDTQCGAKIFDAKILSQVINEPFNVKWLFDQEILTRISKLPNSIDKNWLYEHPVSSWTEIGGSHRKPGDYFKCLKEYFKILRKYGFNKN